ncbi:coiled-coil domain-containing protein 113-like [Formica exsecta]|uniref:coiled-coil domain-containing protein 113-like n=1 Tax=Formica exsecta TaxID=72781 RepID=UPI0011446389|nr:coiled-coil domain-containing protein 113-like [Formica exsecta]
MSRQRISAFSIGSLVLTSKQDELCYYEDMTETELRQALENIARSNLLLKLENDVFERYLARRDPENLQTIAQILETAKRVQRIAPQRSHTSPVTSASGSFMNVQDGDRESVVSILSGSQRITPSLLTTRTLRAGTKFTEEWLKIADITIEQMRLKMTTLKSQIRKVKLQMQQRKELGETLRAVDFEQLNIENQICIREIDEKNRYLLEMKRIVGRYSIALTKHKEKLGNLISIVNEVRNNIAFKKQEIVKLQSEKVAMKVEIKKTEKQLKSVMALLDDFEVPDVIDYIKMRIELQELHKIHKQLSRQRNIQQISLNSNR